MNHCSQCGGPVRRAVPPGDNRERFLCDPCGRVFYDNPRPVVGCLPVWEGRILLCRRSIEPRYGLWTLPSGFMEMGETLEEGARRETREEALAEVVVRRLFAVYSLPHLGQIYALFLADLVEGRFGAGEETLEADLFTPGAIPWDAVAFKAIEFALRRYVEDPGAAAVHVGSYRPR